MKSLRELAAENIRIQRQSKGIRQANLANASGLTSAFINKVERDAANMSLDTLESIANSLDIPALDLLQGPKRLSGGDRSASTVRALKKAVAVLESYIHDIEKRKE